MSSNWSWTLCSSFFWYCKVDMALWGVILFFLFALLSGSKMKCGCIFWLPRVLDAVSWNNTEKLHRALPNYCCCCTRSYDTPMVTPLVAWTYFRSAWCHVAVASAVAVRCPYSVLLWLLVFLTPYTVKIALCFATTTVLRVAWCA